MDLASQFLHGILEAGDIISQDAAGHAVLQLAIDRADLERLALFAAGAAGCVCGGDDAARALARFERSLVATQRT
jgi:hypothetical protein